MADRMAVLVMIVMLVALTLKAIGGLWGRASTGTHDPLRPAIGSADTVTTPPDAEALPGLSALGETDRTNEPWKFPGSQPSGCRISEGPEPTLVALNRQPAREKGNRSAKSG